MQILPANPNAATPNKPAPVNHVGPTPPVSNQPVQHQPALMQPAPAAPQIIHQQVLNWSHFKPELAGRQEEDAEGHFLDTNYRMVTHNFHEMQKCKDLG